MSRLKHRLTDFQLQLQEAKKTLADLLDDEHALAAFAPPSSGEGQRASQQQPDEWEAVDAQPPPAQPC